MLASINYKMNYEFIQKDEIQILKVDNLMLDYENRQLLRLVESKIEDEFRYFIIDLSQLKFINSVGLSFLIAVLTKSRNMGGETIITSVSEKIAQLLAITKLKSIFIASSNLEEGIEAMQNLVNHQQVPAK